MNHPKHAWPVMKIIDFTDGSGTSIQCLYCGAKVVSYRDRIEFGPGEFTDGDVYIFTKGNAKSVIGAGAEATVVKFGP